MTFYDDLIADAHAAADGTWDQAIAMEEFAEPQCFTTGAFQRSVEDLLTRR